MARCFSTASATASAASSLSVTISLFALVLVLVGNTALAQQCEQETWDLVMRHDARAGAFPEATLVLNDNDPDALLFAKLGDLSSKRSYDGRFYFKLVWENICSLSCPTNKTYIIWSQTSNPVLSTTAEGLFSHSQKQQKASE